jgi:hypothetical protein
VAAELQNSFWKFANCFRVSHWEASYRRRGVVRRWPKRAHHGWAWPGVGPCPPVVWPASAPLQLSFGLRPGKIGVSELISSNSENISCVAFLKHKNSRK